MNLTNLHATNQNINMEIDSIQNVEDNQTIVSSSVSNSALPGHTVSIQDNWGQASPQVIGNFASQLIHSMIAGISLVVAIKRNTVMSWNYAIALSIPLIVDLIEHRELCSILQLRFSFFFANRARVLHMQEKFLCDHILKVMRNNQTDIESILKDNADELVIKGVIDNSELEACMAIALIKIASKMIITILELDSFPLSYEAKIALKSILPITSEEFDLIHKKIENQNDYTSTENEQNESETSANVANDKIQNAFNLITSVSLTLIKDRQFQRALVEMLQ